MLESLQFLFSENINVYLQGLGNPFVDDLFKAITIIGSEFVYFSLAFLIFCCFNKKTGIRVAYVILFSTFFVIFAKNLLAMPRPPEYLHKIQESSFGFPSGHAQISSTFWVYLGFKTKNKWLTIIGAMAVISVSLSRVYLGVHYAGDVLGGILLGISLALIAFKTESRITSKMQMLDSRSKYFAALMFPAILISIASLKLGILKEQLEAGLAIAAVGMGYLVEEEHIRFEDAKDNRQRIKRAFTVILILALVYFILQKGCAQSCLL